MPAPDRYAVIGHPVGHSRSPWIQAAFARQCGQTLRYSALEVAPADLQATVRAFFAEGGCGLNVTVPHKQAVLPLLATLSEPARLAGAVNTIVRAQGPVLCGDNTDGLGFVCDLTRNLGVPVASRAVLVLGAGGAARGLIGPLLGLAPGELVIANRTAARAHELAQRFAPLGPVRGSALEELGTRRFDLIVNATASSLAGELPALPVEVLEAASACYDLAYGHGPTPFVRWARAHGVRRCADGLGMLVEQAAESFLLWRGIRPETGPVLAALQRELEGEGA